MKEFIQLKVLKVQGSVCMYVFLVGDSPRVPKDKLATAWMTLPGFRNMHVQKSSQAKVPNGPRDLKRPCVTNMGHACIIYV